MVSLPEGGAMPAPAGEATSALKGEGRHAAKKAGFVAEFFAAAKSAPALAALLILSLLLPTIFMGALLFTTLDPQGNMQNVPAVVVNSDTGATIDGDDRNFGQELCDRLINSNAHVEEGAVAGFNWKFVSSYDKAEEGLNDGSYYVMIHIPADYSRAIASAPGSDAWQTQVELTFNPALDYGTQQTGQSLLESMVAGQVQSIQSEKVEDVFVRVKTASADFLTLTNAGLDLSDGLNTASDGAGQLADGVSQLASGLLQMKQGIDDASSSPEAAALSNALANVGDALKRYGEEATKDNPDEAAEQAALADAEAAARAAAQANKALGDPLVAYIAGGTFTYGAGDDKVTTTETGLISAIAELTKARKDMEKFQETEIEPLIDIVMEAIEYIEEVNPDIEKTQSDVEAFQKASQVVAERQADYAREMQAFGEVWARYEDGTATIDEVTAAWAKVQAAQEKLTQAQADLNTAREAVVWDLYHVGPDGEPAGLLTYLEDLSKIAQKIQDQLQSAEHVQELITTFMGLIQDQATAGANVSGAAGKCEGYLVGVAVTSSYMQGSTAQLAEAIGAIHTAVAGANGQSLLSGVDSLHDGLGTAADTSGQLFESMDDAQKEMKDTTKNSDRQTEVLSQPVALNSKGAINTFGASVAPFYLLTGLWAGCMISALVLNRLLKRRRPLQLTPGEVVSATVANVAPLVAVALIQVLLAMAVVHAAFGLQIDHVAVFYALGILAAISFALVNGTLFTFLGIGALFPSFVLLALQIALSAAFFPVQATLVPILEIGNWILPLPQAVAGMRVAMRGVSIVQLWLPVLVLTVFAVLPFIGQAAANARSVRPAGKHAQAAGPKHAATATDQQSAETDGTHA